MKLRIIHRVLVAVVLVSAAVFATSAWLASRAQQTALFTRVERDAVLLSDTIKNSTRQAMLRNERDMVHRIIELIGTQPELKNIRVFNKDGTVIYSPDKQLIGTKVDKHSEGCDACHRHGDTASGEPPAGGRTREFVDAAGVRQLGVISAIENEPACSEADCHVHSGSQRVLGVLDVTMSLADVDREVARGRGYTLLLSFLAVLAISLLLWVFFDRFVGRPVAGLLAATNAVATGNLDHRIPVTRHDELGQLATSFNAMTVRLAEARNQIYQSNKLASLGRLAAGIAHEINNPLTGVLTYSSFLLKRAGDDPEVRQDLETVVHETKRCREIVRGLLDFARQVPPKKSLVDANEIMQRSLQIVDNQLRVQNIQVTKTLRSDLPRIHADPNQLQQVLINLLVNAADAINGDKREIRVATDLRPRNGQGMLEITVADTGMGIPEKNLGKIFEPFFTTKEHKGTGLGLSVVWGIVSEHGGVVEVNSKVGQGTTFTIRLPLDSAAAGGDPSAS
ncbi:MAG TPA: ATP-binding protein [Mycobacterium sp.]|nr:ATP-binding protein [Mycobacterium sp.]